MPSIKAPPLSMSLSFIAGTHSWLRLRHHIFKQTALIPPGLWEEQGSEEATMLLRFRAPSQFTNVCLASLMCPA